MAFAALEMAVPWLLLTNAEQHLPSGLTGLLIASCVYVLVSSMPMSFNGSLFPLSVGTFLA